MHGGKVMTYSIESVGSLRESDVVGAYDFCDRWETRPDDQPEKRLMRAVLEDVIESLQKYGRMKGEHAKRLSQECEEWIFSNDRAWFFSFINICENLSIDPQYLRRGLVQWKQRALQPTPRPRVKNKSVFRRPLISGRHVAMRL